jgi:predicted Rdx family selenoprotein
VSAAEEILARYQHVVSEFTLITGEKGVFDVRVDDDLIYSKHEIGRHAEPGEVFALFEEQYAADIRPYGS